MENYDTTPELYNISKLSKTNIPYNVLDLSNFDDKSSIFAQNPISDEVNLLKEAFMDVQDEQGVVGNLWNGFKNLTSLGMGSSDVIEKIEQFEQGKISYEEAFEAIESYKNKQEGALSLISNTLTGLLTAGFAISTGGAGALLMGAVVGGAANAGFKTLDRATNKVEGDALDVKEIVKDGVTGAVDGMVSALTAGFVKAPIAGQTVKEAFKQGAIQGAKAGVITGAAAGATDYSVNTIIDDEEFTLEGLMSTTVQNALSGAVFGGLFGGVSSGLAQNKLNHTPSETSKFQVSHNKNLQDEIDNQAQAQNYIDNFNENNPPNAIKGEEEYFSKAEKLSDLSEKSEVLAKKFDSELDETAKQVDRVFMDKTDVEIITARAKGQDSIFSKLARKNLNNNMGFDTIEECSSAIGDAIGIRIQMKNLSKTESKEIVENALKDFGIDATFDDFIRYIQNDDTLAKETVSALSNVSDEIIDCLKTEQMQSAVNQLCEGIRTGSIRITELNNYGDELTSYFTKKQIHEIIDAYSDAVSNKVISPDEPFNIVTKAKLFNQNEAEVLADDVVRMTRTTSDNVNIEFNQTSKGATKVSGYTSGQMNTKHVLDNGEIVNGELQLRGVEVNGFADVEHIPYDIRTGKISASNEKYSEIYNLIKTMSDENYSNYNRYLSDTYKTLRMKELGLLDESATLPVIFDYITDGISKRNLSKLNMEGLIKLSKSSNKTGNKIFDFVLNMIK